MCDPCLTGINGECDVNKVTSFCDNFNTKVSKRSKIYKICVACKLFS